MTLGPLAIPRLRRYGTRLAVVLAAVLLALGLGEWAVRRLLPAFDPSGQVRLVRQGELVLGVPDSRARQRKNTGDYDVGVRFGPRGFRDPRDVAEAQPSDLLVVGDSFAFGWGVEEDERWSNRLEVHSRQRSFNIAMPGQNLDGYDRLLRHARALGSRSVHLIVSLCMENDVGLYARLGAEVPAVPPTALRPVGFWIPAAKSWLGERSALFGLFTEGIHRAGPLEALAESAGLVQPNLGAVGMEQVSETAIAATADRVAALAQGYETTILLVPSRALWLERSATEADHTHRVLVAALVARGLVVVDPRAAFEATGEPLAVHFAKDGHWNERGHRIAAQCLAHR